MSEINQLAPAIMTEVEGHATDYPYPTLLGTIWLIIQSYVRTMMGRVRTTVVADALRHKRYPAYYLRPFHSQPAGYLCPVAASTFDRIFRYIFGKHILRMRHETALGLGEVGDGSIVDLGCGTGALFPTLRASHPAAKLVGVELSPYMLAMARRNTTALHDVSYIEADASATALSGESVRGVTACFMFHEMPTENTREVMREAFRILQPGGRFVVLDTVVETSWLARVFHDLYVRVVHEPYAEAYAKANVHEMLVSCGFEQVRTQYIARAVGVRIYEKPVACARAAG